MVTKIINEDTSLSTVDNTVYAAKNQYNYTTLGLIIDDDHMQFELVHGQALQPGKWKKASARKIREIAQDLKDQGYAEVKSNRSVAL